MPITGKLISEISPTDIESLILQQTAEDPFLEFKAELLDPRKPPDRLEADKADWVADLVAFANAQGGHIIIGMEADAQERASQLKPMAGDQAKRLADTLRDLAIAHIKPHIVQLEVRSFGITSAEWIVIAGIPNSQDKPHMSSYNQGTRFTVRDGSRKRQMAYEEIQKLYGGGRQEQMLAQFLGQVKSINSRLDSIELQLASLEKESRRME